MGDDGIINNDIKNLKKHEVYNLFIALVSCLIAFISLVLSCMAYSMQDRINKSNDAKIQTFYSICDYEIEENAAILNILKSKLSTKTLPYEILRTDAYESIVSGGLIINVENREKFKALSDYYLAVKKIERYYDIMFRLFVTPSAEYNELLMTQLNSKVIKEIESALRLGKTAAKMLGRVKTGAVNE